MKLSIRSVVGLLLSLSLIFVVVIFGLLHILKVRDGRQNILAEGKGVKITVADFRRFSSSGPDFYRDFIRKNRMQFLDDLVNRELLFQEARRRKIDRLESVKQELQDTKKNILVEAFARKEILKEVKVSEEEVKSYFQKHQEEFILPDSNKKQSFEDVADKIKAFLIKNKEIELFGNYVKELRRKAKVKIDEKLLNGLSLNGD